MCKFYNLVCSLTSPSEICYSNEQHISLTDRLQESGFQLNRLTEINIKFRA